MRGIRIGGTSKFSELLFYGTVAEPYVEGPMQIALHIQGSLKHGSTQLV
jgi:hypothetical protein